MGTGDQEPDTLHDGTEAPGAEPLIAPVAFIDGSLTTDNPTGDLIPACTGSDIIMDNELLGALTTSFYDAGHIDHALDLLTSSVDLFDIPAWDSHG